MMFVGLAINILLNFLIFLRLAWGKNLQELVCNTTQNTIFLENGCSVDHVIFRKLIIDLKEVIPQALF